jgi:hypothetical protein
MDFYKIVEEMITGVVQKATDPLTKFKQYLADNKWPLSYPKSKVIKTCDLLIKEEVYENSHNQLLDLLLFQTRTAPKTTAAQKIMLRKIIFLTENSEHVQCDHKHLGIAVFMHGGGFSPAYALPEVICLDCGLNVTIYSPKNYRKFSKEYGLQGGQKAFKILAEWAMDCMKSRGVFWVDGVPNDPIGQYNEAKYKWDKEIPFRISDKRAFEKHTGV